MNRVVLGAFVGLLLAGVGLFWLQGRASVEAGAPGPEPPEESELTREQRRFFRYDSNRDGKITRTEMLSSRTDGFRDLDVDGNNLLTFEEWAVTTAERFDGADADRNRELTPEEFATTAPTPRSTPRCDC